MKNHNVNKKHVIHYVPDNIVHKFVWGVSNTTCGKSYEQIIEHTSIIEDVTCKHCIRILNKQSHEKR